MRRARFRGIAKFRKGGKADTNDKFAKAYFANRSKGTVARAKNLEKRIEKIQTEDKIEKPKAGYALKLDFGEMPRSGQMVMALEGIGHTFGTLHSSGEAGRDSARRERQESRGKRRLVVSRRERDSESRRTDCSRRRERDRQVNTAQDHRRRTQAARGDSPTGRECPNWLHAAGTRVAG